MKVAVRYQSRGGNTKAVAEAIAKAAGVTAEPINFPLEEPVDILFVGGGVYAYTIDHSLKSYLEALNPNTVASVAAFSTGGYMSVTDKISEVVKAAGINVCVKALPIRMGLRNYHLLGGKGDVTLSDKQLLLINNFVNSIID